VLLQAVLAIYSLVNKGCRNMNKLVVDSGIVPKLLSLFTRPEAELNDLTLRTVWFCLDGNQPEVALGHDGFSRFPILFNHPDPQIRDARIC